MHHNATPANITSEAPLKKICLMRLSAIGDVCHAVAMVTRIRHMWPQTQITWVIGKIEYQLVKGLAGVRFVVCDKKSKNARAQLKRDLAQEEFDALLVMQIALRANWLSSVIKAKRRIGFDWSRSKEGHSLFINERIQAIGNAHVLEGFMQFADALGVPPAPLSWDMPIEPSDEMWVQEKIAHLGKYVVVAPTASKAMRNWTPEGYTEVISNLHKKGVPTVLCGGPGPLDKAMQAALHDLNAPIALDLVGQTTLKQMLVVLRQARCVIAPDTGPAHMATTVKTPVVGLYAHSNPLRTGPYLSLNNVVSVYPKAIMKEYNKPWEQLRFGLRAKGAEWMAQITVADVEKSLSEFV